MSITSLQNHVQESKIQGKILEIFMISIFSMTTFKDLEANLQTSPETY